MPYARNGDIRIYYETEGHGAPLLLHQGLATTSQINFQTGYVRALRDEFRLILMDQRGVGRSSKPHDPEAYVRAEQVSDITAVIDDLGLNSVHYWGYSGGAWKGWFCADLAPERFRSLVLGGMGPYFDHPVGEPPPTHELLEREGMEGLLVMMQAVFGQYWTPALERMLREQDVLALTASVGVSEQPEPERFLPRLRVPLLGYAGTMDKAHDQVKRGCELAPLGRFISLPDLTHAGAYFERERILPQVVAFLREAETGLQRQQAA